MLATCFSQPFTGSSLYANVGGYAVHLASGRVCLMGKIYLIRAEIVKALRTLAAASKMSAGLAAILVVLLTLFVPAKALAYGEALAVSPLWGPVGRTVTVVGTGWKDHARHGRDVPIWIGFA